MRFTSYTFVEYELTIKTNCCLFQSPKHNVRLTKTLFGSHK